MIEVEIKLEVKKFPDTSNLKFIKEKNILDIYYDTEDYALLKTGNFLRNRNNSKIDFKLNIGDASHTYCKETSFSYDNFKNNKNIENIFNALNIKYNNNYNYFEEFLKLNNLKPLAIIDKNRKEYLLDNLIVSLDNAKNIGKYLEIEYNLPDNSKINKDECIKYMLDKAKSNNLLDNYKLINIGYVELYLKKHNKKAYNLGLYKS